MTSTPAAIFASSAGFRNPTGVTNVPSSTYFVSAPTAVNAVHASKMGKFGIGTP